MHAGEKSQGDYEGRVQQSNHRPRTLETGRLSWTRHGFLLESLRAETLLAPSQCWKLTLVCWPPEQRKYIVVWIEPLDV